jgi:hypothetical protein
LQGGCTCIGLAGNETAGQITRLLWRKHRFHSFLTHYALPCNVKRLSQ